MISNLSLTDMSQYILKSRPYYIVTTDSIAFYYSVADNYRYMILAIFEYHNIALPDTIAFDELGDSDPLLNPLLKLL